MRGFELFLSTSHDEAIPDLASLFRVFLPAGLGTFPGMGPVLEISAVKQGSFSRTGGQVPWYGPTIYKRVGTNSAGQCETSNGPGVSRVRLDNRTL